MDVIRMQADELVREARLKAIEREHRSKGSILDTRELHKILDPPLYDEIIRRTTKRAGRTVTIVHSDENEETSLNPQSVGTSSSSSLVNDDNDFRLEEQLWKTKSVDTESIQKRRYENPELHKFRENMTPQQKAIFKEKVVLGVRALATQFREEMTNIKREMDRAGVFHPAANAHRAHCMYLMKLNKGFTVESIEVPILRSLKAEELMKERHEAYEEEKRARLIKLATEGKSSDKDLLTTKLLDNSPIIEAEVFESKTARRERTPLAIPKPSQHSELAEKVIAYKNSLRPVEDEKEQLLTMLMGPNRAKVRSKSNDKSRPPPRNLPPMQSVDDNNKSSVNRASSTSIQQSKSMGKIGTSSDKRGGNSVMGSPSKLSRGDTLDYFDEIAAAEDADGSESGSLNSGAKQGDKSSIHSKGGSSTGVSANDRVMFLKIRRGKLGPADPRMLLVDDANRLDQAEVQTVRKVKERSEILDEQISSWLLCNMQQSQIEKVTEGSAFLPSDFDDGRAVDGPINGGFSPQRLHSRSLRSPQTIVPFDDFFSMFSAHVADAEEKAAAALKSSSDGEDSPTKAKLYSRPAVAVDTNPNITSSPMLESSTSIAVDPVVKKNDIVQALAKKDPEFEKFTKQHGKARPMSEIIAKSNAKASQPRRMRIITPLGRDAVTLTDSNGKALKHATKGFRNHFTNIVIEGHDDESASVTSTTDIGDQSPTGSNMQATTTAESGDDAKGQDAARLTASASGVTNGLSTPLTTRDGYTDRESARVAWSPPKSRREGRSRNGRSVKGSSEGVGEEQDMQAKLVATWQTIELSSHKRLWFMQKYSTDTFAAELGRATDLWAEAAVFIVARVHALKLANKLSLGYCVMPVTANELTHAFLSHLHPLLTSRSSGLVPRTLNHSSHIDSSNPHSLAPTPTPGSAPPSAGGVGTSGLDDGALHVRPVRRRSLNKEGPPQLYPLSALAVDVVLHTIRDAFSSCNGSAEDAETAKSCLQLTGRMIDGCLFKSVKRAQELLEDSVYYGDTVVKEWMMNNTLW